ncbi:MAG: FAD:protein FMN transferase [Acidimicrobiales bacterium]
MLLDLGSSAKALAADRAARAVAALGTGVLVSLGGDIAVAGPPPEGGWSIGIAEESTAAGSDAAQAVAIVAGGLATSSTRSRTWRRGNRRLHHIVDPRTGDSAADHWHLVTVAASSCVVANAASTAAVVWGAEAPGRIGAMGLAARLVDRRGAVTTTPGWPAPRFEGIPAGVP